MRNKVVAILFIPLFNCFSATVDDTTVSQYLQSANYLLANKQYRLALESANQAVNLAKTDYRGYYLQAQAYSYLNDFANANSSYQQALALNNNASNLQIAYAGFLCRNGNYSQANSSFASAIQSAIKNHSSITEVYIAYGDCLTLQNELDKATTSYLLSLKDESAPLSAYLGISHAYLLENNSGMAYYYISLYHGVENQASLKMKVASLKGLLNSNSNLSRENKGKLQIKLQNYKQQLAQFEKPSGSFSRTLPYESSNRINVESGNNSNFIAGKPHSLPSAISSYPPLSNRIKTSSSGRKYIVIIVGDTLYNIAQRSNLTVNRLRELNKLNNEKVKLGQQIYLE